MLLLRIEVHGLVGAVHGFRLWFLLLFLLLLLFLVGNVAHIVLGFNASFFLQIFQELNLGLVWRKDSILVSRSLSLFFLLGAAHSSIGLLIAHAHTLSSGNQLAVALRWRQSLKDALPFTHLLAAALTGLGLGLDGGLNEVNAAVMQLLRLQLVKLPELLDLQEGCLRPIVPCHMYALCRALLLGLVAQVYLRLILSKVLALQRGEGVHNRGLLVIGGL